MGQLSIITQLVGLSGWLLVLAGFLVLVTSLRAQLQDAWRMNRELRQELHMFKLAAANGQNVALGSTLIQTLRKREGERADPLTESPVVRQRPAEAHSSDRPL